MLDKQGRPQTANSVQELQNDSFDPKFRLNVVEVVGVDNSTDPATANQMAILPDGSVGANSSLVLTYDGNGDLSTITKTIGAVSYIKTLTYTTRVLTGISIWSIV